MTVELKLRLFRLGCSEDRSSIDSRRRRCGKRLLQILRMRTRRLVVHRLRIWYFSFFVLLFV